MEAYMAEGIVVVLLLIGCLLVGKKLYCPKGGLHQWEDVCHQTTKEVINHHCKKCGQYYV